jgi:hypothetical protein
MLLVVGRDDVTVEVAQRGVSTPLAVTEWRRLPAKVRQALPTAEDLTMTRTVREIDSTTSVALRPPQRFKLVVGTCELVSQLAAIHLERVVAQTPRPGSHAQIREMNFPYLDPTGEAVRIPLEKI